MTEEKKDSLTYLFLRVGVAFAFIYPALSAWFGDPYAWSGYFPGFILDMVGDHEMTLLHAFGIFEIVIGLWILSNKKIFIPSVLATALLVGIVVYHADQMDVIFRDIPIALMSLALAIKNKP